jgi:hypothetical protein
MSASDPLVSIPTSNHRQEVDGAGLLFSDVRLALLLLDEARYRVVARLFGVPREKSYLVTVIALGLAAQAARDRATRMFKVPGGPSVGDSMIGAAVLRESVYGIAGALPSEAPFLGTLVAVAVLGRTFRPALKQSVHRVRASSHWVRAEFDGRYGHLIRSNTRRR